MSTFLSNFCRLGVTSSLLICSLFVSNEISWACCCGGSDEDEAERQHLNPKNNTRIPVASMTMRKDDPLTVATSPKNSNEEQPVTPPSIIKQVSLPIVESHPFAPSSTVIPQQSSGGELASDTPLNRSSQSNVSRTSNPQLSDASFLPETPFKAYSHSDTSFLNRSTSSQLNLTFSDNNIDFNILLRQKTYTDSEEDIKAIVNQIFPASNLQILTDAIEIKYKQVLIYILKGQLENFSFSEMESVNKDNRKKSEGFHYLIKNQTPIKKMISRLVDNEKQVADHICRFLFTQLPQQGVFSENSELWLSQDDKTNPQKFKVLLSGGFKDEKSFNTTFSIFFGFYKQGLTANKI